MIDSQNWNMRLQSRTQVSAVRSQRGSSMIAVLLILLVITILGVMAMRQGLTSLNISTNSQVRQLLVQSSDAALNQIPQEFLGQMQNINSIGGAVGAALGNGTALQEYVFCYRPQNSTAFGTTASSAVIAGSTSSDLPTLISGATGSTGSGYCNLTTDFGSARQGVVTQVAVTIPTTSSAITVPTQLCPTCASGGTDASGNNGLPKNLTTTQRFRVTATAMLPAFATSSIATVQSNCIGGGTDGSSSAPGRINDNTDPTLANTETVTDCLARYGVPSNTQVQEYNVVPKIAATGSSTSLLPANTSPGTP